MNANKIELNGEVLIDLTQDTAQDADVTLGKTYHRADGSLGVGTHECEVGIQPSGTLLITANDEYDVTEYAKAQVAVPAIIEVTELPTTNIDTNAVYSMGGKLYRYEPASSDKITNLANTTWKILKTSDDFGSYGKFNVTGDTTKWGGAGVGLLAASFTQILIGYQSATTSYSNGVCFKLTDGTYPWYQCSVSPPYQFTITGGTDVTNTNLIKWLNDYGELQSGTAYEWVEYLAPEGELAITENGTYPVSDKASVNVNVPIPEGYVKPEGELTLTSNGSHDVSGKATAKVAVPIPALEGTAIPVGEPVERIYFNTNLTIEETNAYLSQLTYVQTELMNTPISLIFACVDSAYNGHIIFATVIDNNVYQIWYTQGLTSNNTLILFAYGEDYDRHNGWVSIPASVAFFDEVTYTSTFLLDGLDITHSNTGSYLTDFNGLPIGSENEKIKNVMSITPFVAEDSDNYKLFGQWKFKAELPVPSEDIIQEVNFTSPSGLNFNKMEITYVNEGTLVYFYKTDTGESIEVYAPDGTFWENYREVNFGTTPQSVSKAYYDYVMANAEFVVVPEWDGSFTKTTE